MTNLSCPECGAPVIRKAGPGGAKTFCCDEHKRAYQARAAKEGRLFNEVAMRAPRTLDSLKAMPKGR